MIRIAQTTLACLALGLAQADTANAGADPHGAQAPKKLAAGLTLTRWTLDAGGGSLTNGAGLIVHSSIGQPDVGKTSSGELALRGGFRRISVTTPDVLFSNSFE
jgi:hypothetical protein